MYKSKSKSGLRKFIKKIHLWIGLSLCLPLVISGLTGTVLVFQDELEELFYPEKPVAISGNSHLTSEIIEAAKSAAPEGAIPTIFRAPSKNGAPAAIRFTPKNKGKTKQILIDPLSLEIIDNKNSENNLLRQILLLHSTLLIKDYGGRSIIGWFGVGLLILGISGLIIWWPKKGYFRSSFIFHFKTKGFNFHRDLHKAVGIWSAVMIINASFTGINLAFPKIMENAISSIFPARDLRGEDIVIQKVANHQKINIDQAIEIAVETSGKNKFISANLPVKETQPYRINVAEDDHKKGQPLTSIFIHPQTGEIIEVFDPENYSIGEIIISWQHSLHQGLGLGPIWKALVFTTGFLPLIFAITGINMWLKKRQGRKI